MNEALKQEAYEKYPDPKDRALARANANRRTGWIMGRLAEPTQAQVEAAEKALAKAGLPARAARIALDAARQALSATFPR